MEGKEEGDDGGRYAIAAEAREAARENRGPGPTLYGATMADEIDAQALLAAYVKRL